MEPKPNLHSQETSNEKLLNDLQRSINDAPTLEKVSADFTVTFNRLGASKENAKNFSEFVLLSIKSSSTIEESESKIKTFFETEKIEGKTIFTMIQEGLQGRFEIIFDQLKPYLKDIHGKVIDYGCGSGSLTQIFHDRLGLDIEGVDVRNFKGKNVSVPVRIFDGYKVPVSDKQYEAAVLTNVIHHEKDNEKILEELDRIVEKNLIIIETVPEADNDTAAKKDWGRMLLNDTLWNRFFNYANIPVPGTYETPNQWIERFKKYGWKVKASQDLGFDQPTIQDRHHLFVFER